MIKSELKMKLKMKRKWKLKMPENLKDVNSMAGQFLLTLFATTLSIVLTFGVAAIIDHNKKRLRSAKLY